MADKKSGKIDKYTTYINAFKVANDELSKLNLDTNDNGIDDKELEEEELTAGQKSLVWESQDDKLKALAQYLTIDPTEVEYDPEMEKYYKKGDFNGYYVYAEDEDYEDEAAHFLANQLRNGHIPIKEMDLADILVYAEETSDGFHLSYLGLAEYLLTSFPIDSFLATEVVSGKTYIIL